METTWVITPSGSHHQQLGNVHCKIAYMMWEDGHPVSLSENRTSQDSVRTIISFLLKNRKYIYLYAPDTADYKVKYWKWSSLAATVRWCLHTCFMYFWVLRIFLIFNMLFMSLCPRTHRATCFKEMAHFCVCSLTQYFLLTRKVSQGPWSSGHAVAHHSGNTSDFWKQARPAPQQELSASIVKGLKSTLPLSLLRRWNIFPLTVSQMITLRKPRKWRYLKKHPGAWGTWRLSL